MTAVVDSSPFGARRPNTLKRTVIVLTRLLPANWLGLRLAILLRRVVMSSARDEAIDTDLWGLRLRLYPRRNGCEKNALFTPQMFDVVERDLLANEIEGGGRTSPSSISAPMSASTRFSWRSGRVNARKSLPWSHSQALLTASSSISRSTPMYRRRWCDRRWGKPTVRLSW